jgi:hypothetical protein
VGSGGVERRAAIPRAIRSLLGNTSIWEMGKMVKRTKILL